MLKCVLNRWIKRSKALNKYGFGLHWNRSSSKDQQSVRVWFVHWSRNAKCVVTRVLAVCEYWACARVQHISHIINSLFIVSRVLHRIIKLESFAFSFIILCKTLGTIKSRRLSVTSLTLKNHAQCTTNEANHTNHTRWTGHAYHAYYFLLALSSYFLFTAFLLAN